MCHLIIPSVPAYLDEDVRPIIASVLVNECYRLFTTVGCFAQNAGMNRGVNWRRIVITALIGSALTAAVTVLRSPLGQVSQQVGSDTLRALFFGLLVALVVITSALGKPKRRATTTDFPPPFGAKLIVWASLAVWMMLLFPPLDLGMYWLAALFGLGPAYTIWRWPETISIDELQIFRHAWCHPKVSMQWQEIASISKSRDVLVLKGLNGDKIRISTLQVGADELFAEIRRHTGIDVRLL